MNESTGFLRPTDDQPATRREVGVLSDQVAELQTTIQQHQEQAQQLVAQALTTVLEQLPAAIEQAMRRVATDQTLHKQIGASVLEQATGNWHKSVGRFVMSKWFAIGALVLVVANAIGWPATLKALFGLAK